MVQRTVPKRRGKRLAAEAGIVVTAALTAFAVAHASLLVPSKLTHAAARPGVVKALAPAAPATAEDDFLISFVEPVPGHAVVSPFGLRQLPWEGAGRLHEGVDISADFGVPVVAAAEGVVVTAGEGGGYGRYVAVRHAEGLTSFYAHLGAILPGVKPGLQVAAGQALGKVGSTGSSTGPHLHFEIRDAHDQPLNPAFFLGKAFAEAGDLPLDKAKRYSGRVRIAQVSFIPADKRALMEARNGGSIVVHKKTTEADDLAAAERNLEGEVKAAAKGTRIDGMSGIKLGPDGRPRAQLSM